MFRNPTCLLSDKCGRISEVLCSDLPTSKLSKWYLDVVDNKRLDVVDIEKLGKSLENASPLEIMFRALEKYENDIAIAFW
ncbi:hypothetical protein Tco_0303984 [Tanacetum coccineum]